MRVEKYDLLAITDAGRALNLSPSALRNWIAAGELKCLIASDGSRLFTAKQLEEFQRRRVKRKAAKEKVRRAMAAMIEKAVNE